MFNRVTRSLINKELRQILRNKQILAMLLVTPTLQMLAYGLALNPDVKDLNLGVIDFAATPDSRELVAALVENKVFDLKPSGGSTEELYKRVDDGAVDAGLVIPPEFQRLIAAGKTATVQVVLSAVDANSAGIAAAYISQIIFQFNRTLVHVPEPVSPQISFIYNPGLNATWFFVPAVIAMSLTVAGTLVSTSTLLKEKETGTIEQLMMAPASPTQILIAKLVPLVVVLFLVVNVSLLLGMTVFGVPLRGSYFTFCIASFEYMFVLLALGLAMASYASNQRQAMLSTFFIMMPLIQLSGALAPIETMPHFFRYLSMANPMRFFIACLRGILLKGNGIGELWPELLILFGFSVVFMTISVWRFRKQLA
ncbi:MAG TPA: ABC transporter permease [Candidatus Obscuribacterales bacterium]